MKQFQIAYENDLLLREELKKINAWRRENDAHVTLWRVYSVETDAERVKRVCEILDSEMPDALYLGCSTSGSIAEGALAPSDTVLTCTVFERETTRAQLLQLPFTEENVSEVVSALKACCEANPWVRCVELHATMMGMAIQDFCDEMSTLPENIQVFGGGACNADLYYPTTYVFSKAGGFSNQGIVFLLLGGEDFHAYSTYLCGWKSLKRRFRITKANRQLLSELDGKPAFDIYRRYLSVENGDDFNSSTTEFPLMMVYDDAEILRNPLMVNEDGTIVMITDLREGTDIRLAYGDPQTILSSIRHDGQRVADFKPEVIQTFSCAGRRVFWGNENVSRETELFQNAAPTSGFFSCSEFLRVGGRLWCFNMTLVLVAMREGGPAAGQPVRVFAESSLDAGSERMSLIRRFVSFIEESAADYEELNSRLALASITDSLTGLYNRGEIESRIRGTVEANRALSLIMLDIDNFKRVNDLYGHKEGDRVITALADTLKTALDGAESAAVGRWGGEEFMIMLPDVGTDGAVALAEKIRTEFSSVKYELIGPQTVSIGVTQAKPGESADTLYTRVDRALYIAKYSGKDRTVKLDRSDI